MDELGRVIGYHTSMWLEYTFKVDSGIRKIGDDYYYGNNSYDVYQDCPIYGNGKGWNNQLNVGGMYYTDSNGTRVAVEYRDLSNNGSPVLVVKQA